MEKDKEFVKTNLPNFLNLGVVLVDVSRFKQEVS